MKKEYVKPAIAVEEFLVETVMMDTSGVIDLNKPAEPGTDADANEKRGWGNLWN